VDYLRFVVDSLGTRRGEFIHAGWLHSPAASVGNRGRTDPNHPRTACRITQQPDRAVAGRVDDACRFLSLGSNQTRFPSSLPNGWRGQKQQLLQPPPSTQILDKNGRPNGVGRDLGGRTDRARHLLVGGGLCSNCRQKNRSSVCKQYNRRAHPLVKSRKDKPLNQLRRRCAEWLTPTGHRRRNKEGQPIGCP